MPGTEPLQPHHPPELPAASAVEPALALDCRHYRGERPCAAGVQGVCPAGCDRYRGMGQRVLVIKLGALGDVIRTAALLPGLKAAWPESHITWVTRPAGVRMLGNHPLIDRLLPFDAETNCHLDCERFDLLLSLDKEPAPAALAMRVSAGERRGIGLSRYGTVFPLNAECQEYFRLGLDDEFKFRRNRKTYQELLYQAVGLPYCGQKYELYPGPEHRRQAARRWRMLRVRTGERVIGLNTGAGDAFANKTWRAARFTELAHTLATQDGWRVALLGGPREADVNRKIAAACAGVTAKSGAGAAVVNLGAADDAAAALHELEFAALVERCDALVTGDTMAMHVAIALRVPCVVLFGPTCPQEIDVYERGVKLVTRMSCAPCYRRVCNQSPNCMDDISVSEALAALRQWAAPATEAVIPAGAGT